MSKPPGADDTLLVGQNYDPNSKAFAGFEFLGGVATLPFGYSKGGGLAIMALSGGNASTDCYQATRGGSAYDCGEAVAIAATANAGTITRGVLGVSSKGTAAVADDAGRIGVALAREKGVVWTGIEVTDNLIGFSATGLSTVAERDIRANGWEGSTRDLIEQWEDFDE